MHRTRPRTFMTALVAALIGSTLAAADDHFRVVKADIDKLDAELHHDGAQWIVDVKFEVELETSRRIEGLALVLHVDEHGRTVTGDEDQPLEVVIPLDNPSDVDDDEVEFKQSLSFPIPEDAVDNPAALRLTALVATSPDAPILARRDESIDFDIPSPPRDIHVGVSFGVHNTGYVRHHYPVYQRSYCPPVRSVTVVRRGWTPSHRVHRAHFGRRTVVWRR
jgi:hypothetical protein